jgi:hypothetical protein
VGSNFEHYLRKWQPRLENPQDGDVGVSWIAFFLPIFWLGYRKMYAGVFLYAVVSAVSYIALRVMFIEGLGQPDAPLLAVITNAVLLQVVCLLYGNAWYLSHVQRQIERRKNTGYKGNELLIQLARSGGTSVVSIFLGLMISTAVSVVGNATMFALGYSL